MDWRASTAPSSLASGQISSLISATCTSAPSRWATRAPIWPNPPNPMMPTLSPAFTPPRRTTAAYEVMPASVAAAPLTKSTSSGMRTSACVPTTIFGPNPPSKEDPGQPAGVVGHIATRSPT